VVSDLGERVETGIIVGGGVSYMIEREAGRQIVGDVGHRRYCGKQALDAPDAAIYFLPMEHG
jgi:hypothetical protein